jgi:vancomycin aglycone glucosyltransferase
VKNVVIGAIGTAGDVRPIIEICRQIQRTCRITLVAPPENEPDLLGLDISFRPLGDPFNDVVARKDLGYYREQISLQFGQHQECYEEADAIVGVSLFFAGRTLAEKYGKPYRHVFYSPQVIPSSRLTPPSAKRITRRLPVNALLWRKHRAEANIIYRRLINTQRQELGLEPIGDVTSYLTGAALLMVLDKQLYDVAELGHHDAAQVDFPIFQSPAEVLDEETAEFVGEGRTALVSFGSVAGAIRDREAKLSQIAVLLQSEGYKTLVVDQRDERVGDTLYRSYVPYDLILKHCSLAIHHGGIGTAMSCLVNMVPQILFPQALDQFFWADLLTKKGLALRVSDVSELPQALAEVGSDGSMAATMARFNQVRQQSEATDYSLLCR